MGRQRIFYGLALALGMTLFWAIPGAWSEEVWEDLLGGPSRDLGSQRDLVPRSDMYVPPSQPRYSDLANSDDRLLHDRESRLRSAYITQAGDLQFTKSTDCNRLKPVCVGQMGIAETTTTPDIQLDPLSKSVLYEQSPTAVVGQIGISYFNGY
jgi:hypothetical protein